MPDRAQHRQRAEENERLARSLNLDETLQVDWAIVILFYSALHYVDAFLAGKNFHPASHEIRDNEIGKNGSIAAIYADYRRLKDKSEAARYQIANFHRNNLPQIEARFEKIKAHLIRLM